MHDTNDDSRWTRSRPARPSGGAAGAGFRLGPILGQSDGTGLSHGVLSVLLGWRLLCARGAGVFLRRDPLCAHTIGNDTVSSDTSPAPGACVGAAEAGASLGSLFGLECRAPSRQAGCPRAENHRIALRRHRRGDAANPGPRRQDCTESRLLERHRPRRYAGDRRKDAPPAARSRPDHRSAAQFYLDDGRRHAAHRRTTVGSDKA